MKLVKQQPGQIIHHSFCLGYIYELHFFHTSAHQFSAIWVQEQAWEDSCFCLTAPLPLSSRTEFRGCCHDRHHDLTVGGLHSHLGSRGAERGPIGLGEPDLPLEFSRSPAGGGRWRSPGHDPLPHIPRTHSLYSWVNWGCLASSYGIWSNSPPGGDSWHVSCPLSWPDSEAKPRYLVLGKVLWFLDFFLNAPSLASKLGLLRGIQPGANYPDNIAPRITQNPPLW